MVHDLLPLIATLNKKGPKLIVPAERNADNDSDRCDSALSTTSNHYAIVESDHPYHPASVANYRVKNNYFCFSYYIFVFLITFLLD